MHSRGLYGERTVHASGRRCVCMGERRGDVGVDVGVGLGRGSRELGLRHLGF